PLSVALHVLLLLVLIATIKVQNARELLMVTLQQVGGGGGSKHDEMRDVDMPEMTMPDTMPQMVVPPKVTPEITRPVVQPTRTYVRDAAAGGIGTGGGNGIGSGSGPGIGAGFGGFIGELRRKGLDIVLVIDDTGSMDLIINDVRDRMDELVMAVHR